MANHTIVRQKQKRIEIPLFEYNLLKEICNHFKKQALLSRILEAEENLKKGRVEETNIDEFIKNI